MPELRTLLEADGFQLKKHARNELSSPCPWCGGTDRFIYQIEKDRYWCRQCGQSGDAIQYLRDFKKMSFQEAEAALGRSGTHPPQSTSQNRKQQPAKKTADGATNRPRVVATYDYRLPDGVLMYQVQRIEPGRGGRKKDFVQRQPGRNDGQWVDNVKGVELLLYRLPDIINSPYVFIMEGEKDVDLAHELDIKATTNSGGAEKIPKQQELHGVLDPLAGKKVFILPDNDDPGLTHGEQVAQLLYDNDKRLPESEKRPAQEIRIVHIPNQKFKGDFTDFVNKVGRDRAFEMLQQIVKDSPLWKPPTKWIDSSELLEMDFRNMPQILGNGVWPIGTNIMLAADTGVGKSVFRSLVGVHLATATDFIGWTINKKYRVAIAQFENTDQEEQKRLKAIMKGLHLTQIAPGYLTFINRKKDFNFTKSDDRNEFVTWIRDSGAEIIIYDNLSSFHNARENENSDMLQIMNFITRVNAVCDTSSLVIHHFKKNSPDDKWRKTELTIDRVRGASSIVQAAVSVLLYGTKRHEKKILRSLVFSKVRDGPPRGIPPWLLEADEDTYLLTKIDEDTLCPPKRVTAILDSLGGQVTITQELVDAIITEVECADSSARKFIKAALLAMEIERMDTPGRGVGYKTTGKEE